MRHIRNKKTGEVENNVGRRSTSVVLFLNCVGGWGWQLSETPIWLTDLTSLSTFCQAPSNLCLHFSLTLWLTKRFNHCSLGDLIVAVEYVNPKLDIFDIAILTTFSYVSYVFLRVLRRWQAGFAVTKNVIFSIFIWSEVLSLHWMRDDVGPGHSVIEVLVVLIVNFTCYMFTFTNTSVSHYCSLVSKVMSILGIV